MKVIEETFVKGQSRKEVVTVGKKKFIRIENSSSVDWRRYKTFHQVKKSEFEHLEQEYQKIFPTNLSTSMQNMYNGSKNVIFNIKSALVKQGVIENDDERRRIERGLVGASKDGTALLAGVKYVKEQTGWGLKDSKDFVEGFFERRKVFSTLH